MIYYGSQIPLWEFVLWLLIICKPIYYYAHVNLRFYSSYIFDQYGLSQGVVEKADREYGRIVCTQDNSYTMLGRVFVTYNRTTFSSTSCLWGSKTPREQFYGRVQHPCAIPSNKRAPPPCVATTGHGTFQEVSCAHVFRTHKVWREGSASLYNCE